MIQPKIRFNGFKDEWVEGRLKDILKLRNIVPTSTQKKLPVLTSSRQGLMNQSDYYKDRLVSSKDLSKYHIVSENAITYRQMSDDNVFVFNQNKLGYAGLVSPAYPVMIYTSNVISEYLMAYLNNSSKMKQEIHLSVEGTTRTSLPFAKLSKFKIQLPTLSEQQKIGALFSKYDAIIALREQKLEELNALKKGLLQEMFPKNDAKVPELRFDGFKDEWVEKKLGEVGLIQTGNTPSTSDLANYSEDGLMWITPTDITSSYVTSSHKRLSKIGEKKSRIAEAGSILVTSIASIGKNTIVVERVAFNQQINALTPTSKNDSYFLLAQSKEWSHRMKNVASKGTMDIVNKSTFSNIRVYVPSLSEQQKIGQLFKQLDDRITNEQTKIEQLKAQKQGLLQRML